MREGERRCSTREGTDSGEIIFISGDGVTDFVSHCVVGAIGSVENSVVVDEPSVVELFVAVQGNAHNGGHALADTVATTHLTVYSCQWIGDH